MNEYESGKYLPVLYTIPIWNLIIGSGRTMKYYVPWTNECINCFHLSKYLSKIGLTDQDYYDRWILNITVPSDRPKCKVCGWRTCSYNRLSVGYRNTCCETECKSTLSARIRVENYKLLSDEEKKSRWENRINIFNSKRDDINKKVKETKDKRKELDPLYYSRSHSEATKKSYRNNPERAVKQGITISNNYKNPEYSKKMSEAISKSNSSPEVKEKISKGLRRHYYDHENRKKAKVRMTEINRRRDVRESRSRGLKRKWQNPSERMLNPILKSTGKRKGKLGANRSTIFSPYENKEIKLDSGWERSYFLNCLKNKGIVSVIRCPFSIQYTNYNDGDIHSYVPDFLVEYRDGSKLLVEIKPHYLKYNKNIIRKSIAAMRYCKEMGIRYIVLTEFEL